MTRNIKTLILVLLILTVGLFVLLWSNHCPLKAKALDAIIVELVEEHNESGSYIVDIDNIISIQYLRDEYSLYLGKRVGTNLMWDAQEVSKHDLSVLIDPNYFVMFAPVGKIKQISFSSFPVWRYGSDQPKWVKGGIHWSMAGAYWSKD